ncbi:hypothetical protein H6G52_17630 [Limnothrix sp. FACHB-881]|uniref:hypothetical protein n=1 Tax=Limnothrix sp. FACHB-881 TaxID=2692819 RepID=UPI0016889703|nr:hypothetical protein [Limnothrix sp. FACHB-881]MBD2637194.1 hypothetical protein [Limnothrix sp. FACHB-881]
MVLYLAQVQQQETDRSLALMPLAVQSVDRGWQITRERQRQTLPLPEQAQCHPQQLVLIEVDNAQLVTDCQDATDWILELIKTYLSLGVTPEELAHEANRLEQWKQSLTLQNQELSRRSLELEIRRDQLQALEVALKMSSPEEEEATEATED